MPPEPRKIKVKDILEDIHAGMDDQGLIDKYFIPRQKLPGVFKQLVERGLLNQSELDNRKEFPELDVVAQIEKGSKTLFSPMIDFLDHFMQKTMKDRGLTNSLDISKVAGPFENCFTMKRMQVAELATACLKSGDLVGAQKAFSLLNSNSPESRQSKRLRLDLESHYRAKIRDMLDSCWERGQFLECERLAASLTRKFPESRLADLFKEGLDERRTQEAENRIEEHIATGNLETAYRAIVEFKRRFPDERERMEFFSEDLMPQLKAVRKFEKKFQSFTIPSLDAVKKEFHWLPVDRMSSIELKFLRSPIEAFKEAYPGVILHPAVKRMLNIILYQFYKVRDSVGDVDMLLIPKILAKVAANRELFVDAPDVQATRLWHLLTLTQMFEDNVKTCHIVSPQDDANCSVCTILHGQEIRIKDVIFAVERCFHSPDGNFFPNNQFPRFNELQLMAPADITEYLPQRGWFAPPFCHHCTCLLLAST